MLKKIALATAAATLAMTAVAEAQVVNVRTKRVTTGLNFPVGVTHAPGDTSRLFIIQKQGQIRIFDLTTNTLLATPFLSVTTTGAASSGDERGLLGLAFDPNYATNGQFYVYYTNSTPNNVVARYTVSANPNVANSAGVIMMQWSDPFSNHNGGWMGFGPDGNLYIASGDGGSANDPGNRAQTITNMKLGKMLRIKPTVGGAAPYYTIPASNPFFGAVAGDDEIWSYGLRNPWRCSFDRETGALYIADVGQNAVEEINYEPAGTGGRNYGWRCTEGTSNTGLTGCTFGSPTLTAPIHTYTHVAGTTGGYSLTGGYVYRGCRIPDLQGTYFFADYVNANIWTFRYNAATNTKSEFQNRNSTLGTSAEGGVVNQYAAFGEDANGELYIADHGGQIYKIIPASGDGPCAPPPPPGDLNGDGRVDGADLGLLLSGWGNCGTPCPADLDANGVVNGADIGILLGNWG